MVELRLEAVSPNIVILVFIAVFLITEFDRDLVIELHPYYFLSTSSLLLTDIF